MKTLHLTSPNYDKAEASAGVSSEGAHRATGEETPAGCRQSSTAALPDPEVPEAKPRRRFIAAYKLRILDQADQCTQPGQIGALLRKDGLYSSNLACWRKQRDQGVLDGLTPAKRGRKPKAQNPLDKRLTELERENRRLQHKLRQARIIIEAQKNFGDPGHRTESGKQRRQQMIQSAHTLSQEVWKMDACNALKISRATFYRHLNPSPGKPESNRPRPPLALSALERQQVIEVLHCDNFQDKATQAVYATLLDQGQFLCSIRTIYRILADEPGGQFPGNPHAGAAKRNLWALSPQGDSGWWVCIQGEPEAG